MRIDTKQIYREWKKRTGPGRHMSSCKQGFTAEQEQFIKMLISWRSTHGSLPTMKQVYDLALQFGYRKIKICPACGSSIDV